MTITEEQRDQIKGHLPKGWIETIALECNVGKTTVRNVLHRGQNNAKVVEALVKLARENKDKNENLRNTIAQL